jgi:6-pyruvoyltetrahydropterin/6-carboxytetrahydropterin synthase
MYRVIKRIEISGAHKLSLPYESKCRDLHGHNWIITVFCQSETLDENGMVVDFSEIKNRIVKALDHKVVNEVLKCNPTAENIARWCCEQITNCYRVDVQETTGNIATYEKD